MSSINKLVLVAGLAVVAVSPASLAAAPAERDPVTLSVVAVNPAAEKTQVIPVKIDLPQEVTPKDVLATGELKLEFDEARGAYYVFKDDVALAPKETRVFEVTVRDVWHVPQPQLASLRQYNKLLLGRLETSDYFATAKELSDSVAERLQEIETTQNDESLSRKSRIGAYRYHLQMLTQIKEDLARLEKLLTFVGGVPVPEMLEKSPLMSEAPSQKTTWLIIFLIVTFIGLLGGQFFLTWHRRVKAGDELAIIRKAAFGSKEEQPGNGRGTPSGRPSQLPPR